MLSWTIGEYFSFTYLPLIIKRANRKKNDGIVEEKISYGTNSDQHLLLFAPKGRKKTDKFIFFLHGGGWRFNNPSEFRFVGNFFAQNGYVVISSGYRYVPDSSYPAQIEDAFSGFKKAFEVIDERFSGLKNVIIAGSSSGAHLGSFLIYDRKRQSDHGIDPERIKGFVSNAGPLNFDVCRNKTIQKLIDGFMGKSGDRRSGSPIEMIRRDEPIPEVPVLCIHGEKDPIVEIENSETFVEHINKKHGAPIAELVTEKGVYHSDLNVFLFLRELKSREILLKWMEAR